MISRKSMVLLTYLLLHFCFLTFFASLILAENLITIGNGYGLPGSQNNPVEISLENSDPVRGFQMNICDEDGYHTCKTFETTDRITEDFFCKCNPNFGDCCLKMLCVSLSDREIAPG
ncbi:MAG: hypothetical protein AMJ42_06140, partial [Deltaproteobacteria bacterium DG_8]